MSDSDRIMRALGVPPPPASSDPAVDGLGENRAPVHITSIFAAAARMVSPLPGRT